MKKQKNNLDERQEQKLLSIEKNGYWFAFCALLISIFVQQIIFGIDNIKYVAGEWIIFMILAVYVIIACLKNGIWDRRIKANPKTNLLISLVSSIAAAAVAAAVSYANFAMIETTVATFVFTLIATFVLSMIALSISTAIYKKRARKLENEDASEDSVE